jgi:hypothetical protein
LSNAEGGWFDRIGYAVRCRYLSPAAAWPAERRDRYLLTLATPTGMVWAVTSGSTGATMQ